MFHQKVSGTQCSSQSVGLWFIVCESSTDGKGGRLSPRLDRISSGFGCGPCVEMHTDLQLIGIDGRECMNPCMCSCCIVLVLLRWLPWWLLRGLPCWTLGWRLYSARSHIMNRHPCGGWRKQLCVPRSCANQKRPSRGVIPDGQYGFTNLVGGKGTGKPLVAFLSHVSNHFAGLSRGAHSGRRQLPVRLN